MTTVTLLKNHVSPETTGLTEARKAFTSKKTEG